MFTSHGLGASGIMRFMTSRYILGPYEVYPFHQTLSLIPSVYLLYATFDPSPLFDVRCFKDYVVGESLGTRLPGPYFPLTCVLYMGTRLYSRQLS